METRRRCIVGTAVCGLSPALAAALYACAPQAAPQEGKADDGKAAQTEPVAIDWSPTADCAVSFGGSRNARKPIRTISDSSEIENCPIGDGFVF